MVGGPQVAVGTVLQVAPTSLPGSAFAVAAVALGVGTGYFGFRAADGSGDERTVAALHAVVAALAAAAYVAQLSGLGLTETTLPLVGATEANWVRYLGWLATTPLLLVALVSFAGAGWRTMAGFALADAVMIATGFVAANAFAKGLVTNLTTAVWAFTVAVVLWAMLLYGLFVGVPEPDDRAYGQLRLWLVVLWSVYPALWVFANAGAVGIGVEASTYAVLDVLAKLVWGAAAVRLATGADAGTAPDEPRPGRVPSGD